MPMPRSSVQTYLLKSDLAQGRIARRSFRDYSESVRIATIKHKAGTYDMLCSFEAAPAIVPIK